MFFYFCECVCWDDLAGAYVVWVVIWHASCVFEFFLVLNLIGCNIWMYSIVGMQIGLEWDYLDEYF